MKFKSIILFLIIISISLIIQLETVEAEGIIIADDQRILEIFKAHDQSQVINLAEEIRGYDKVILHLGAKKVFSRGHPFFYRTSRENLKIFAAQLQKQKQELYLWFLDSFGSQMFLDIYDNHQEIIDANYDQLQQLDFNYQGVVIDLEWINLDLEESSANNSDKYLEIVEYLKNKFANKKAYAFISIVDDQNENSNRGYDENEILNYLDNIITMLYIKDSGFFLADGELKLIMKENRINMLRNYYQQSNYQTAVSLEGGLFLEKNQKIYFIKTTNKFAYKEQSQLLYSREKKYYLISAYQLEKNIKLKRNDGQWLELEKGERLHFLKIKADTVIKEDDYIWEYFQLQK